MEWYWILLIIYFSVSLYFILIGMTSYCIDLAQNKLTRNKIPFTDMYIKRFLFGLLIFVLFPIFYIPFSIIRTIKRRKRYAST